MTTVMPPAAVDAPGRLPLLGHALALKKDTIGFFRSVRELGPLVRVRLGPQTAYVVNDVELIRQVLVTDAHSYDKGVFWDKVGAIVGNGLANSSGATHLRQRRMMQPAFHRQRIAQYATTMGAYWAERVGGWQPGQVLSIPQEMGEIALDLVARTVFSSQLGAEAVQAMRTCFPKVQDGVMVRTMNPFPALEKLLPGNKRFQERINRIWRSTEETITAYRATGEDHGDLLSMLISARDEETGEGMSDTEIRDQVLTIALAAGDTTANALAWGCYELGRRPELAQRIADEVQEVTGGRALVFEDLAKLEFTDRVVQEIIRYYAFWGLMRRTLGEVRLGGVTLPKGTQILLSPVALHRDDEYYQRPTAFDPDRWLRERSAGLPRTAWIPFGAGARQCIGDRFAWTEIVLGLGTIFSRWRLEQLPGQRTTEVIRISINPSALSMTVRPRRPV